MFLIMIALITNPPIKDSVVIVEHNTYGAQPLEQLLFWERPLGRDGKYHIVDWMPIPKDFKVRKLRTGFVCTFTAMMNGRVFRTDGKYEVRCLRFIQTRTLTDREYEDRKEYHMLLRRGLKGREF